MFVLITGRGEILGVFNAVALVEYLEPHHNACRIEFWDNDQKHTVDNRTLFSLPMDYQMNYLLTFSEENVKTII